MVGVDTLTGDASIIVQLNRQDALQRAQTATETAQEPAQTERLYSKDNRGEAKTAQRVNEIPGREPDNDAGGRGNVTQTRGQNVNILA